MRYPGGKNSVYQKIINLIPPHQTYIEAFAGSGAILRYKRPAACTIAIDAEPSALEELRWSIAENNDMDQRIEFVNADAIKWLAEYPFRGNEFIYADPPYLLSTRRQHRHIYRCELDEPGHIALLDVLKHLPCKVMLSGYWSELYDQALAGWVTSSFQAITRSGQKATEYLWMNYPTPIELHDYRYLGGDFRERERIKRKKQRWVERLKKMPRLERQALLSALDQLATFDDERSQMIVTPRSDEL